MSHDAEGWPYFYDQGWYHSQTEVAPHWHYIPPGTDRALCGEVWLPYEEARPLLEDVRHVHPHPAECRDCGLKLREREKRNGRKEV